MLSSTTRLNSGSGGGGGGGNVTGTGAKNQVTFWTGGSNISGSGYFQYFIDTGIFQVDDITTSDPLFEVIPGTNPEINLGNSGIGNGTTLSLVDSDGLIGVVANDFTVTGASNAEKFFEILPSSFLVTSGNVESAGMGATYQQIQTSNATIVNNTTGGIFSAGDVDNFGNQTLFQITDFNGSMYSRVEQTYTVGSNAINLFQVDSPDHRVYAGDYAGSGNNTAFIIDDFNRFIVAQTAAEFDVRDTSNIPYFRVNTGGQQILAGDVSLTGNDTLFTVDVSAQWVTLQASQGFHVQDTVPNQWFRIDPSTQFAGMGDLQLSNHGTRFTVEDSSESVNTFNSGRTSIRDISANESFAIDNGIAYYALGNLSQNLNSTRFEIYDGSRTATITNNGITSVQDIGGNPYLYIDVANGIYDFGDINATSNATGVKINNPNGTVQIGDIFGNNTQFTVNKTTNVLSFGYGVNTTLSFDNGNYLYQMGDVSNTHLGTKVVIDDNSEIIRQVTDGLWALNDTNSNGAMTFNTATHEFYYGDLDGIGNGQWKIFSDVSKTDTYYSLATGARQITSGKGISLTNASGAQPIMDVQLSSGVMVALEFDIQTMAFAGSDTQIQTQHIKVTAVNKAGVYTYTLTSDSPNQSVSSGTFGTGISITPGASKITITSDPNSSLTSPTITTFVNVTSMAGNSFNDVTFY